MSVHYKFKSALDYDTITFDGLHISVRDLKNSIMQQKRIGKNTEFDLQVTNAQTKEVYDNEETLISKNTSLLIARIPSSQTKSKTWEGYGGNSSPIPKVDEGGPVAKALDLASVDASEIDKIQAMMTQSAAGYHPSTYTKVRGSNQIGEVPKDYQCFKCHQGGHWIKDCPLSQGSEPIEIKKSTGIPRSFMVPVDGPQVQGAMMTPNGSFAVPVLDHQAYTEKSQPAPPEEKKPDIPEDLLCSLCSDLLTDAVMIPCCGDSYCDECIRTCLLESEEHECPACHERDISPGTLIPNRYLRNSVSNFKSTTGYMKRLSYKPQAIKAQPQLERETKANTEAVDAKEIGNEKPIIREADSTEPKPASEKLEFKDDLDLKDSKTLVLPEGPPGVSPKHELSPKVQQIVVANPRDTRIHKPNNRSPRRPHHLTTRSPSYQEPLSRNEDRPGTPTVDEPGVGSIDSTNIFSNQQMYNGPPPVINSVIGLPPPSVQGPTNIPSSFSQIVGQPLQTTYAPPAQGPPPNFRLPPPGTAPPFMQSGYNAPPRPVYDCNRPPMSGPPPFNSAYPSGPPRGRDYRDIPRRGRTPLRVADDPLEAFNRMLREKDERDRRAKQRKARSYSRSSSRSFSRSPRRLRSRSPRRRSRSPRSFTISRSRSRSFSPSPRPNSPRQYSPKRGVHSRYRSPARSPSRYRYKEQPLAERDRGRDREMDREREKDFRDNRGYSRERDRERDFRDREPRDRDHQHYEGFDRGRNRPAWNSTRKDYPAPSDQYYHQAEMGTQQPPAFVPSNRYPQRDQYPPHHLQPLMHQHPPTLLHPTAHLPAPVRRYDDVAPPGTEQPPIPGVESTPRFETDRFYDRNNRDDRNPREAFSPSRSNHERERDVDRRNDHGSRREHKTEVYKERKHDRYSRSPERHRYASPRKHSKERERERDRPPSLEKHKRSRRDESVEREKRDSDKERFDRKKDVSDDEKSRRNKEKKKKKDKKEKKEEERKKRKEKREKREHEKKKSEDKVKVERKSRDEHYHHHHRQPTNDDERLSEKEIVEKEVTKQKYSSESANYTEENLSPPPTVTAEMEDIATHSDVSKDGDLETLVKETKKRESSISKEESSFEPKADLYDDVLSEGIDSSVIETYGKIKEVPDKSTSDYESKLTPPYENDNKSSIKDDDEESEKDILELHTNEAELKTDLDKSDVLAQVPGPSKWECEDDGDDDAGSTLAKFDSESDKSEKVTSEVIKRAKNALFTKAINAIRPIEIKKISLDRIKLYSGERSRDKKSDDIKEEVRNIQVTIPGAVEDEVNVEPDSSQSVKPRLSVKERLGCKVDDLDRIVKIEKSYDRNLSTSLSPLSRRAGELNRNLGQGEGDDRKKTSSRSRHGDKNYDRSHRSYRAEREQDLRRNLQGSRRDGHRDSRRDKDKDHNKREESRREDTRVDKKSHGDRNEKSHDDRNEKSHDDRKDYDRKKRLRSRSKSVDKRKRRERKDKKKEKVKRSQKKEDDKETKGGKSDQDDKSCKLKSATDKRKATLDEANFVPDYDLDTDEDKEAPKKEVPEKSKKRSISLSPSVDNTKKKPKVEEEKEESQSSDSSESSSEEEKRKKRHRKHKRKRTRKESSSSSESESESESSDDEKSRKRKKTKKKQKKRKKSRHK